MIQLTAHQLAKKLLVFPDLPIFIDGIGEDVGISCDPELGRADRKDVVVIEIITRKRFESIANSIFIAKNRLRETMANVPEKW